MADKDKDAAPAGSGVSRFKASEFGDLFGLLFLIVFGLAPFLAGVLLIGFQSWGWISTGVWQSWSVIDGLALASSGSWLSAPHSFFGLHAILNAVPLSLALCVLAALAFWVSEKF